MKDFLFIVLLVLLSCFLGGCRAKSETSSSRSSTVAAEIGVELRKADSLWSSLAESSRLKIEFYPPYYNIGAEMPTTESLGTGTSIAFTGSRSPAAPLGQAVADLGTFPFTGDCGGGLGAVKSIEILTEKTEDMGGIRTTDSVSGQKSYTKETRQEERASEARHDNGTVAILAVVAGLVVLAIACLLIKKYLKR